MVVVSRRILASAFLSLWMGGFTFYAAVVVPVGQDVLGSHREQGFVTRRVTDYLNASGAIALLVLAWDTLASRAQRTLERRLRLGAWIGLAGTLAVLVWLHQRLDALLDPDSFSIRDHRSFYALHRWYLLTSTVQWAFAIGYAVLSLSGPGARKICKEPPAVRARATFESGPLLLEPAVLQRQDPAGQSNGSLIVRGEDHRPPFSRKLLKNCQNFPA
jgi:hypothetical protein